MSATSSMSGRAATSGSPASASINSWRSLAVGLPPATSTDETRDAAEANRRFLSCRLTMSASWLTFEDRGTPSVSEAI